MPISGPSQNEIHIIAAARIMEKFDLEHPDSGILDTDIVTVKSKRHIYTRESTFLASELRQLDIHVELNSLMASLSQDKTVMSTTLDPAPESSTCETGRAATERALLHAGVVEKKRKNLRSKGPRTVTCDDGTSWLLPIGVYYTERTKSQIPYKTLSLQISVGSSAGSCQVNGREVRRAVTLGHTRPGINKRTILAMRSVLVLNIQNASFFPLLIDFFLVSENKNAVPYKGTPCWVFFLAPRDTSCGHRLTFTTLRGILSMVKG